MCVCVFMLVYACLCVSMSVCARACICVRVRLRVCVRGCTRASEYEGFWEYAGECRRACVLACDLQQT